MAFVFILLFFSCAVTQNQIEQTFVMQCTILTDRKQKKKHKSKWCHFVYLVLFWSTLFFFGACQKHWSRVKKCFRRSQKIVWVKFAYTTWAFVWLRMLYNYSKRLSTTTSKQAKRFFLVRCVDDKSCVLGDNLREKWKIRRREKHAFAHWKSSLGDRWRFAWFDGVIWGEIKVANRMAKWEKNQMSIRRLFRHPPRSIFRAMRARTLQFDCVDIADGCIQYSLAFHSDSGDVQIHFDYFHNPRCEIYCLDFAIFEKKIIMCRSHNRRRVENKLKKNFFSMNFRLAFFSSSKNFVLFSSPFVMTKASPITLLFNGIFSIVKWTQAKISKKWSTMRAHSKQMNRWIKRNIKWSQII